MPVKLVTWKIAHINHLLIKILPKLPAPIMNGGRRTENMKKDNQKSQIVIYKSPTGETKIDVRFDGDTVWLTQNTLAELFQTTKQNISLHINNIFDEGELQQGATVKYYLTVQKEGGRDVSRELEYYNLDLIISVGYRVKSSIATAFRQWATARLEQNQPKKKSPSPKIIIPRKS